MCYLDKRTLRPSRLTKSQLYYKKKVNTKRVIFAEGDDTVGSPVPCCCRTCKTVPNRYNFEKDYCRIN
jgi:hypothetical protein